jgi:hypothetical protein
MGLLPCEVRLLRSFGILAHELKRIGCGLHWLSMERFPERWIIILRAVYPRRNFPHSLQGRERVTVLSSRPLFPQAMRHDVAQEESPAFGDGFALQAH